MDYLQAECNSSPQKSVVDKYKQTKTKKQNDWATSMSFIGLFVGALIAGFGSDKFGRKVTIMVSIALNATLWIIQSYVPGYYAFVVLRILVQDSDCLIELLLQFIEVFYTEFSELSQFCKIRGF